MQTTEGQLRDIVAEKLNIPVEKIKRETRLREDLKADAATLAGLVPAIAKHFRINFPEGEDFTTIMTFDDLVDYVKLLEAETVESFDQTAGHDDGDVDGKPRPKS